MADEMSMALAELLGKITMNSDVLRDEVRVRAQALMERKRQDSERKRAVARVSLR